MGNLGGKLGSKRPRNKKISELFRKEEATGAILQLLKDMVVEIGVKTFHTRLGRRRSSVISGKERRRGREYLGSLL